MGEVWFGEDAVDKMVGWTEKHYLPIAKDLESETSFIMDLGCGNGHLLLKLKEELGLSHLLGVDYSPQAVELARQVARDQGITSDITYKEMDILSKDSVDKFKGKISLALDKGTLDAISLADPSDLGLQTLKDVQNAYASAVHSLLQSSPNGMLLITSCNWTENELVDIFSRNALFTFHSRVKYPSFKFGGQTGQTIVTLAFTKNITES